MFEPQDTPRVFALPPGCDYSAALVAGLRARLAGQPPEAMARVTLYVNTRRMQRRLNTLFAAGPAGFLPRIRLITDLAHDPALPGPAPVSALRRRLDLAQAVAQLVERQPELAPRSAVFDLADSLAALMDEMAGEGVAPEALQNLDVSRHSAHWARSLHFIDVIARYWAPDQPPGLEVRQRRAIEALAERWAAAPPQMPVILAGSTGSRGATALFMQAVARLPQGAVVLPGFDFDMPGAVWDALDMARGGEDHPQFRFRRAMQALGLAPGHIARWSDAAPATPARNRLLSLALRPAPVTDQWRAEGPALTDIGAAAEGMTLVEAPSPRAEALAIALRLRQAAETGETAALITPDRVLTRRVTAALDRWGILPDDSAGLPLALSPPGRLLRMLAEAFGTRLTGEALLTLLAHPLSHSGAGRGAHLKFSRDLELEHLRGGPPFADFAAIRAWAAKRGADCAAWADWIGGRLEGLDEIGPRPLATHLADLLALAEGLAAGPRADGSGALWEKEAGEAACKAMRELEAEAEAGGTLRPAEFAALVRAVLDGGEVRSPVESHPHIMIWGTLEARVQGADLVILGGLNEGVWPQLPLPDAWLNRDLRVQAGLLLPERRIGLSAHDFQQAVAAPEAMLTRAIRDGEAPTVPARWLNRLTNLMGGIGPEARAAFDAMTARGRGWLDMAAALETPAVRVPAARRPSPRPPVAARPRRLSVTRIKTLIRDPHAIYAQYVLDLRPLNPLRPEPDPPLRGQIVHDILHRFVDETRDGLPEDARAHLMHIAQAEFAAKAPWPAARRIWLARLARVADGFLADEARRRAEAYPAQLEIRGRLALDAHDFTLTGTADRVDITPEGRLVIYDYKTGKPPTEKEVRHFDRQLPLEGAMAERGAFDGLAPAPVAGLRYVGLGTSAGEAERLAEGLIAETWQNLQALIAAYDDPAQGYTARTRMQRRKDAGDYDHLSRLGEWDEGDPPTPEDMT